MSEQTRNILQVYGFGKDKWQWQSALLSGVASDETSGAIWRDAKVAFKVRSFIINNNAFLNPGPIYLAAETRF